jgi:HSP20 family molecular chaperone IbpA
LNFSSPLFRFFSCDLPEEDLRVRINEICFGVDERNIYLPLNVNQDEAQCNFKDGLLAIKFPKIIGHKANKKLEISC